MKINLTKFRSDFKGRTSPLQSKLPQVRLYEMDLSAYAAKQEELIDDESMMASFTKACTLNTTKKGLRAPGYWTGFYSAMAGSSWDLEGFALSNAVGSTNCVMQFLPGSCTKVAASYIAEIAFAQLGKLYDVFVINGDTTSNAEAEGMANDAIEAAAKEGRKVWFISQGMAARSFSVPAIDTVLLTYDGGDLGATLQKLSRALTAGEDNKIGNIVSVAIDPKREDKVAAIVLDAAAKAAEQNDTDLKDELKRAYATFPLFSVDADGCQIPLSEDAYIERAMSLNASLPLIVNRSKLYSLDMDVAFDLANQITKRLRRGSRAGEKEAGIKGKRYIDAGDVKQPGGGSPVDPINLITRQLDGFVHNLDVIRWMVDADQPQLSDILNEGDKSPEYFIESTGMTPSLVRDFLAAGLLRQAWVDAALLKVDS